MVASSILYVVAGLFWGLEYIEGRGVVFCFMDPDWPRVQSGGQYVHIIWYALPLAAFVTVIISSLASALMRALTLCIKGKL